MIEAENVNHCKSCLFIYLAMLLFHSKGANNFGVDFIGVYYLGLSLILPHAFLRKYKGANISGAALFYSPHKKFL